MLRVLPVLLVLALTITAIVECVQTPVPRLLPRWLWFVVVVVVPVLGPLAWFALGRLPRPRGTGPSGGTRRGPVAPDDDPSFLRQLEDDAWRRKARERRERGDGGA